jgi:Plasmid pRiA4b ORF-3-like protein
LARTWLQVEVVLSSADDDGRDDPGRIFLVGPGHTFGELADAINAGFARWDLGHLHEFRLAAGRRIGFPDDEFGAEAGSEDQTTVKVADAVVPGDEFEFLFDFGEGWRHRCRVLADKADPREAWGSGPLPARPVAIWGWGWIPDQYGRRTADDSGE